MNLFKKIINDIADLPIPPDRIVPIGLGDPLLYPHLIEAIKLCKKKLQHIRIELTTNGIFFPKKIREDLIKTDLDILLISINFFDNKLYKKFNGVDKLAQVIKNTEAFLKFKKNRKPNTVIQLLNIGENKVDLKKFFKFWQKRINKNDYIYVREPDDFAGYGTIDISKYNQKITKEMRYPCNQIFDSLMINVDGDCFPCCLGINVNKDSKLCIGNVRNNSIKELFSSTAVIQQIRNIHKENKYQLIEICNQCNEWKNGPNMFYRVQEKWK